MNLNNNLNEKNNEFGIFENLKIIPILYEQNKQMSEKIKKLEEELTPKLDLTTRKGVRKFLNVSDRTITAFTSRTGEMIEGKHYIREYNDKKSKIRFISNAIINFKKTYKKGK